MTSSSSYVPYIPDTNKWENHFENMAERKYHKQKDFYVVRPPKTGSGASTTADSNPILVVSPVQQDVARAESDLKDENINSSHLAEYNQSQTKARKRNNPAGSAKLKLQQNSLKTKRFKK